jgi:hypothetical protein
MGIYREKCQPFNVLTVVVMMDLNSMEVLKGIDKLKNFICDFQTLIPEEARIFHEDYLEARQWKEEGILSSAGHVQRKCLHYGTGWHDEPDPNEPGKQCLL